MDRQKTMDWFGKSSKAQDKNDLESLGITFEPIVFYPERNEYELRIELPGCPKDVVKVTYEKASGKLKVQGQKQKTEFVQQFSVPADCLATGIYGRFRGEVLHIIMPRLLSEWRPSEDASSKQEDDQKASSDRKAAEQAGENQDKLPARVPAPPPSDPKSTDEVKEIGREIQRRSTATKLPAKRKWIASEDASSEQEYDQKASSDWKATAEAGEDRENLPARISAPPPSDQKSIGEVKERGGNDRDKLPARVPAPLPSDPETTEKSRRRDSELFPEISAPPPSALERSRSVKELRENYQRNLSKTAAPPPPPPPPLRTPSRAVATEPWNRKTTEIRARKEVEEDQKPPSTVAPASPSSDQEKFEQRDDESDKSVVKSQKHEKESEQEDAKNAKIVTESKDKAESEEKKPCAGGNETLGLVAKVKETGKAAVAAAMKEENRLFVMIGAAVLTIVVIGASLRSSSKRTKH